MATLITLDIDDDVLIAAEDIAARENRDVGEVVSDLIRQGFDMMDGDHAQPGLNIP